MHVVNAVRRYLFRLIRSGLADCRRLRAAAYVTYVRNVRFGMALFHHIISEGSLEWSTVQNLVQGQSCGFAPFTFAASGHLAVF